MNEFLRSILFIILSFLIFIALAVKDMGCNQTKKRLNKRNFPKASPKKSFDEDTSYDISFDGAFLKLKVPNSYKIVEYEGNIAYINKKNDFKMINPKKYLSSHTTSNIEEYVRSVFIEKFPGYKFLTCRPKVLRSPITNYPCEIDILCDELGIANEVNGPHHKRPTNYKGKKTIDEIEAAFKRQRINDISKYNIILNDYRMHLILIDTESGRKFINYFIGSVIESLRGVSQRVKL